MVAVREGVTQLKRITTCFIRFPMICINIFEFGLGTIGIPFLVHIIFCYQTMKRATGDQSVDLPVLL